MTTKLDIIFWVLFFILVMVFSVIVLADSFGFCVYNAEAGSVLCKILLALVSGYLGHRYLVLKLEDDDNGNNS